MVLLHLSPNMMLVHLSSYSNEHLNVQDEQQQLLHQAIRNNIGIKSSLRK
jgi:hypothetical protein